MAKQTRDKKPLAQRMAERLNAADFGVTGRSAIGDSEGLRRAIQAATEAGGREVFLPPGTYRVCQPIVLQPKVFLRGAGWPVTRLNRR